MSVRNRACRRVLTVAAVFVAVCGAASAAPGVQVVDADVVIYGGTSAGVIAAVQIGRMGGKAVIVEPGRHLGGMSSSGLGLTDIGVPGTIGGLAREFYHRIFRAYQDPDAWKHETRAVFMESHPNHWGIRAPDVERLRTLFIFEPHVAEHVYDEMAREAGATVYVDQRLDLAHGVQVAGGRIAAIRTESGTEFRGKVFIDATYEGDLMAHAGVTYTVGRESRVRYNEPLNGIMPNPNHGYDPYVKPGRPESGLLPGIDPRLDGDTGQADSRVQCYNFRVCLTDVPANRIPITKPTHYDPALYEMLARYLEHYPNARPGKHSYAFTALLGNDENAIVLLGRVPNRKTDCNADGPFSIDLVGGSFGWPEGDYRTRNRIWQDHKDYVQGLLWFAAHDRRVPSAVRAEVARWGLPKDEFVDNGHWPWELYVREARRMVSDYVITEHDTIGARVADDPIAIGSYCCDSHKVSQYVDEKGKFHFEGQFWDERTKPYPISYRAIRPREEECSNLLVTGCMSSSHVAFASLRMEPVFMMIGQAAGAAAQIAAKSGLAVQAVPYAELHDCLHRDLAILSWPR